MIWAIALPTAQADAAARKRCHTNTHSFARGDLPGVGKVFSATLDALVWCRRGRRVVGPVRPDYDHKQYKGGTAGLFYKWEGWEARNRIPTRTGTRGSARV